MYPSFCHDTDTVYCTLEYTTHCTLYYTSTVYTVPCTLHTTHYTLHTTHYTQHKDLKQWSGSPPPSVLECFTDSKKVTTLPIRQLGSFIGNHQSFFSGRQLEGGDKEISFGFPDLLDFLICQEDFPTLAQSKVDRIPWAGHG